MTQIILDRDGNANADREPIWMVLHTPSGSQRRRWGADMARIADELVRCDWVIWRDGSEVHAKHRCLMAH